MIIYGHAILIDPHTVEVRATNGSLRHLRGEQILVATGSSPFIPDFAGLAQTPYLTSDLLSIPENLGIDELPDTLLTVGGGYIALELGQMFSRLGSQVTLLAPSKMK